MRAYVRLFASLLFLGNSLLFSNPVRADDDVGDEYDENARVMRVSLMKGEVSLRRSGELEWESAQLNLPLVEGDVLASGRDSHFEIQIDARNFVRVSENAVLKIVTLREEGIALSLTEGGAIVRLARFDHEREYFEIDAPGTTIATEKTGLYRLDVAADGSVRVTVRGDGRARIYSEESGFVLRNDRTARLVPDGQNRGDWEFTSAATFDQWDFWNDERERYLASRLRYDDRDRYYDNEVWGAEELDAYGDWSYTRDYGYVWRPHITVINNYYDWAPYRHGHWRWCPPYGWTWIADEPWGWAPYHYGRWVYYNNYWCWAPRGYGYAYRRAFWRPALVAFIYIPTRFGERIAWYPLTHGQRDPRSRYWGRHRDAFGDRNRDGNRAGNIISTRPVDPAFLRAVSTLSTAEFGAGRVRAKMATTDVARRALKGDPVPGRLPVTPRDGSQPIAKGEGSRADALKGTPGARPTLNIDRSTGIKPPRDVPDRITGAARRTPGASLDGELRRLRVFNNREPRVNTTLTPDGQKGGAAKVDDVDTGAVMRPGREVKRAPSEDGGVPSGSDSGNEGKSAPRNTRSFPSSNDGSAPDTKSSDPPGWKKPDSDSDSNQPRVKPSRPVDGESSTPKYERPVRVPRSEPTESPKSEPRRDDTPTYRPVRPTPREEPPPRRESPPPPPRNDPPPSPKYEAPAPKQERPAPSAPSKDKGSDRPTFRPKSKGDQD
jgi:hypothetical protein